MNSFGDTLRSFLEQRQPPMSTYQLAKELNIDYATVYRWLHNEVPSLHRLSDIKRVARLLNLTDAEQRQLEEAQITALREKAEEKLGDTSTGRKKLRIKKSGKRDGLGVTTERVGVIKNYGKALETVLDMFDRLPQPGEHDDKKIILTMNGETIFRGHSDQKFHDRWRKCRQRLLQNGWRMVQLYRLDGEARRVTEPLEWLTDIMGALQVQKDGFQPRYFDDEPGLLKPPYEVLFVPNQFAVVFFSRQQFKHVNAAVVTTAPAFMEVLRDHVEQLECQTREFLTVYRPPDRQNFMWGMARREDFSGNRLLVKPDFAGITRPMDFFDEATPWAQQSRQEGWGEGELKSYYTDLFAQFRKKMDTTGCHYYDICSQEYVEKILVTSGQYSAYQSGGINIQVGLESVKVHIKHIIDLLKQYDRYHIVYLTPEEEKKFPLSPFCEICGPEGREHVFLESRVGGSEESIALEISEPRIVQAFKARFLSFYASLPDERTKDQQNTIRWLEGLLEKAEESD